MIIIFHTIIGATAKTIKKNSLGFLSIGYNGEESHVIYESKAFSLSLDDYHITGGRKHENGSGRDTIQEVILTNDKGDRVRLDRTDFIGIDMNR